MKKGEISTTTHHNRFAKLETVSHLNKDLLFDPKEHARSDATTALDDSVDHYTQNQLTPKQVDLTVPFPTKCPECEYNGFTEA